MLLRIALMSLLLQPVLSLALDTSAGVMRVTYLQSYFGDSYSEDLLRLALDKTVTEYGPYSLVITPMMSMSRQDERFESDSYENAVRSMTLRVPNHLKKIIKPVLFPTRLGLMGYRVCVFSKDLADRVQNIRSLKEFSDFQHVQGWSWPDTDVFRHNKVKVFTVGMSEMDFRRSIINMYKMVNEKKADAFCRAAHEIRQEKEYQKGLTNLSIDKTFAIFYSFPSFFYLNRTNTVLHERIYKGLLQAYHDGSFHALWEEEFGKDAKAVLKGRRLLWLSSPWDDEAKTDFKSYYYLPEGAVFLEKPPSE